MNIHDLTDAFQKAADPEKASIMAAYMKHHFDFLGIRSPERRVISTPFLKAWEAGRKPVDWGLIHELWERPEREYQYVGIDYLKKSARFLMPGEFEDMKSIIMKKSWWDSIDNLASGPVGQMILNAPNQVTTMDAWIRDENLWVRRTAIIHQLSYKDQTDEERLFTYCRMHSGDSEFFIAKAIGWALREYGKTNPEAVLKFVDETPLQKLSKREALKHLR
ncbi:DNA alkylation repair protein [Salisediminibacterium beveridgei]|nr:DNA alkylation repair protein [Salisediminibacterium beveridgei]